MTAAAEARQLIVELAGPVNLGPGRLKQAYSAIATVTGLSPRRIRAYWNGEVTRPSAADLDALRTARARSVPRDDTEEMVPRSEIERLKAERDAEIEELRSRLERIEEAIAMARALMAFGSGGEVRAPVGVGRGMADGA